MGADAKAGLIALAIGVTFVAAGAAAIGARKPAEAAQPSAPAPSPARSASRIYYPQDAPPRLALPGGRERPVLSVLRIDAPMAFGTYRWDAEGVPPGPVWVRVDVARQLISVFRGGHEIGSAVILYGAEGKPTPTGVFPVLEKAEHYHSRTYDAPMPFMLRLTADGVAIHGSHVRKGWATHGCIGVPQEFARRLFQEMQLGDEVFIVS